MLCNRKKGQSPIDGRTVFPWAGYGLQGRSNNLLPFQANGKKVAIPYEARNNFKYLPF